MAHSKQAQKRIRTDELKRQRNKATRTGMRSALKKAQRVASAKEAQAGMPLVTKRIDKAAKAGVIHKNAAARQKSRLAKAANKLAAVK